VILSVADTPKSERLSISGVPGALSIESFLRRDIVGDGADILPAASVAVAKIEYTLSPRGRSTTTSILAVAHGSVLRGVGMTPL
jgi:hypothetical protein